MLPRRLSGKESTCQAGDASSIPGSGRYSGEGNGNPFQYSCLGNAMDRGAWQVIVHMVIKSQIQLSNNNLPYLLFIKQHLFLRIFSFIVSFYSLQLYVIHKKKIMSILQIELLIEKRSIHCPCHSAN